MELHTEQKEIRTVQTLPEEFDERAIDCDFILPDYLPDITAVLKCIVKPTVQSHQISGDRVTADGMTLLQLLYLDEERKCIHSYETSQPFSANFTLKAPALDNRIDLSVKVNYVNCRPTGPRRVEVHGAFQVILMQSTETVCTVLETVTDDQLVSKQDTITYSVPCVYGEKAFTVNEVVELQNNQSADSVLRTEMIPTVTECKCLTGKAVVKGELLLKSILVADRQNGSLICSQNRIPFSQLLDAEGLTEDTTVACEAVVLFCETHLTQNPVGENTLLSVAAKLKLSMQGYRTEIACVLTDAYHTAYPIETEYEHLTPVTVHGFSSDVTTIPLTVELPNGGICSVEDCWCDVLSVADREGGNGGTEVCTTLCMLTRDAQDCYAYYERQADFVLPLGDGDVQEKTTVAVWDCTAALSGNRVDVRLTVAVNRKRISQAQCRAISNLSLDERRPFANEDGEAMCPLKVYFAGAGESLWDIAKSQHIAVEKLCRENNLFCDTLSTDTALIFTTV